MRVYVCMHISQLVDHLCSCHTFNCQLDRRDSLPLCTTTEDLNSHTLHILSSYRTSIVAMTESAAPTSYAWRRSASGQHERPLTAAEDRWDAFHRDAPSAWTDFCSSAFFDVSHGPHANSYDAAAVQAWAEKSLAHVLLQAPLLMGTIEADAGQGKRYAYKALGSLDDLRGRTEQLLVVELVDDTRKRVEELSSAYYADKKRVSVELGPALIRFVFLAGPDGQYALFLQTTHTLIDFWALASLFELALDTFTRDEPLPATIKPGDDVERLSPAYLEVLKEPLSIEQYNSPTEKDKEHAAKIMGALLRNPLGLRIERATAEEASSARASVATMTIHHTFTPEQTAAIVQHAKAHGQSVNQVIQAAHITALQIVSPVAKDNDVRTHAPSGILNILPRTKLLDEQAKSKPSLAPARQPFMGALMVPYVCDIGPLLDLADASAKDKARSDAFWFVANEIGQQYRQSATATAPLKAFWDKGPALWGGFVDMLPAVYAGAIPS